MRRRIYLMRHGAVSYFGEDGQPVDPATVPLTDEGRMQARGARDLFAGVVFDRVIASGLPRTLETAQIVVPTASIESWPELRELESGHLAAISDDEIEDEFVNAFHGVVANERRFLGGETIGALFDRILPELGRLVADESWDIALLVLHGAVNRAILSYALTGERLFLGQFEQAPGCVNVLDIDDRAWLVRAVNVAPTDPTHRSTRATTMEQYWERYRPVRQTGR